MTYEQNIQRLSQTSRFNTSQAQRFETEHANEMSKWHRDRANKVIDGLSDFSKTIRAEREKQVKAMKLEGEKISGEHRVADAKRLIEVKQMLANEKLNDTTHHELKAEVIKLEGLSSYPDADRLAKLSHYQQIGYTQERLRNSMVSYPDHLNDRMMNGETPYTFNGVTYTAKQIREDNIHSYPVKEALLQVEAAKLYKDMGLDRFSPEILEVMGVNKSINAAKDAYLGKVRKRYSIDASAQTQAQAGLSWKNSARTGDDVHHFLASYGATVDKNGALLGNEGAWSAFMKVVGQEGIAMGDPGYADTIGNLPIPLTLAKQVGAKPGTTFAQHWPKRFANLKASIKKGYVDATNEELKYQKAAGVKIESDFIKANKARPLSNKEVNEWKRKFTDVGLPIPAGINKYETAMDRDQAEDADALKALVASQNGYITHEQLNTYNPIAALEYREKATNLEQNALKDFDTEKLIKASLDKTWTDMGIKGNEKSPAYTEALKNAKLDYIRQYNNYIAMGHSAELANYWALNGKPGEAKTKDGQDLTNIGVLTEIQTKGPGNKYVVIGQNVEKDLKPGNIRVARIATAKREIRDDPNVVSKRVIGGDYGRRQLTTIMQNIEKHGNRGVYMDAGALQYYKGIARGFNVRKTGGWWGILDAQLKANGHPGLSASGERPPAIDLITGLDANGMPIPDPRGDYAVNNRISNAMLYPSFNTNLYITNTLQDTINYGSPSVWDTNDNLEPYLRRN